jgi:cell division protein FtsL
MPGPRQREVWALDTVPHPGPTPAPRRRTPRPSKRKAALRRRRFTLLILVPVVLMLGSIYLHTVSADLTDQVQDLRQTSERVRTEGEQMDLRAAKLTAPGRIRSLARQSAGMREPDGTDLRVYKNGEDGDGKQEQEAR